VYPWKFAALVDDRGFVPGEFVQSALDIFVRSEFPCKMDVSRVMPGFGFVEASVENVELRIGEVISQQHKAFAAAGFDQCGDQQAIHGPAGFLTADKFLEFPSIGPRLQSAKSDAALLQQIPDELKVVEFFPHDLSHLPAQILVLDVIKHQIHRR